MFRGGEIGYMDIFKVIEKTMEAHKKDLNMQPSLDEIVSVASICVCVCVCVLHLYIHAHILIASPPPPTPAPNHPHTHQVAVDVWARKFAKENAKTAVVL